MAASSSSASQSDAHNEDAHNEDDVLLRPTHDPASRTGGDLGGDGVFNRSKANLEVCALAEKIASAQQPEITTMKDQLEAINPAEMPHEMGMPG